MLNRKTMPKKYDFIERRQKYIKERIDKRNSTIQCEVRRISRDLFLSERTVYRDYYAKDAKKEKYTI